MIYIGTGREGQREQWVNLAPLGDLQPFRKDPKLWEWLTLPWFVAPTSLRRDVQVAGHVLRIVLRLNAEKQPVIGVIALNVKDGISQGAWRATVVRPTFAEAVLAFYRCFQLGEEEP